MQARCFQRLRQISTEHLEPAVAGPFDRFEQDLAAQRAVTVLVAMVDQPPVAGGAFDRGGVATRPP